MIALIEATSSDSSEIEAVLGDSSEIEPNPDDSSDIEVLLVIALK